MSALHKLKAYFGMVPTDDLEAYDESSSGYRDGYQDGDDYDSYGDRTATRGRRSSSYRGGYRPAEFEDDDEDFSAEGERPWPRRQWSGGDAPTRGALAVDPQREPVTRIRPAPEPASSVMSRITTLHPKTYKEARTIGEHYRDGTPVIINLTEMADADAQRLVDFAAGLAFALRGSIDKVTTKVFLLSPANVDVTAEQRKKLAEGGLFGRG
ncbi:cell division protein SepF [Actinoalloteichus spitiensis]|uniref:cell division protein SepF n=1 Tax=Actinoalloteichus spitiensis TaxID=252394 RepID=UPI000365D73C|nr:cell division protein SepF [Actinoalloteichus spitiensis]